MTANLQADTLVIGAGAAGLAAAVELSAAGRRTLVLEARNRPGGRILTDRLAPSGPAIELGAEFVHGKSPLLLERIALAGDVALDAGGERWSAHASGPRPANRRHDVLGRVFARLSPPDPDLTFDEYLAIHRRSIPAEVREIARTLVEGFDAADASRISARSVLEEWNGPAAAAAPTFRPARGYDTLIHAMVRDLRADAVELRYDTIVREIRWRRDRVLVDAVQYGRDVSVEAKRAIITLPLGVLQLPESSEHRVSFDPELCSKSRALRSLASGPVIKLMMTFSHPFWDELQDGRYRNAAFFFAPRAAFPTFWTSLPVRSALLAAWCAGPKAERLATSNEDEIIASALDSLGQLFGPLPYASWLARAAWHDWQRDPFACGAYSYVLKGGSGARRALAAPVGGTLFFAGEACDTSGEAATVAGALRSGVRAARQILGTAHSSPRRARSRRRGVAR